MENDYQTWRIPVGIASITWCLSPNDGGGNCMARFAASWGNLSCPGPAKRMSDH